MTNEAATQFDWNHVLYRLFNSEGDLIYIGITNNIKARFQQHLSEQSWWGEVADCQTEFHRDRSTLERIEADEIASLRPRHNKRGNPDRRATRPIRRPTATRRPVAARSVPVVPVRRPPSVVKVFPDGARLMSHGMVYGPERPGSGDSIWCMDPGFRSGGISKAGHERCTVRDDWHRCDVYPWPADVPFNPRAGHHL